MAEHWALGRVQPFPRSSGPLLHRQLRAVLLPWVTGSVPASAVPCIRACPAGMAVPERCLRAAELGSCSWEAAPSGEDATNWGISGLWGSSGELGQVMDLDPCGSQELS